MSKKKIIIFLLSIKVRKFDYIRFDADILENRNKTEFEFHELTDFIHPGFSKKFTADRLISDKVKSFSSFDSWKKEILKQKDEKKLIVYNSIPISNLESFKINFFLSRKKFITIEPSNLDHPIFLTGDNIYKIKWLIRNIIFNKKKIWFFIKSNFFKILKNILKIEPKFFLKCGLYPQEIEKNNRVKILKGHSKDYNIHLKTKKIFFNYKRNQSYGLYLESPTPEHNIGDLYIMSGDQNSLGTAKNWLKSLNNFFNVVEKSLKIKILIAPHPKIKHLETFSSLYNGREILKEKTSIVSRNSKLIISRHSTAMSFAAIYKIPSIFVYNNELKLLNPNFIINQKKFANALGQNPINMDENFTKNEIIDLLKFNKKYYEKYIKLYHTSRNDEMLNIDIIEQNII